MTLILGTYEVRGRLVCQLYCYQDKGNGRVYPVGEKWEAGRKDI